MRIVFSSMSIKNKKSTLSFLTDKMDYLIIWFSLPREICKLRLRDFGYNFKSRNYLTNFTQEIEKIFVYASVHPKVDIANLRSVYMLIYGRVMYAYAFILFNAYDIEI